MFERIVSLIRQGFSALPDVRKGGNATQYEMVDAALSAFSVFMLQSPSFLAHQRDVRRLKGQDNLQTLFGAHQIPSDNQIRNLLDPIPPRRSAASSGRSTLRSKRRVCWWRIGASTTTCGVGWMALSTSPRRPFTVRTVPRCSGKTRRTIATA
jgi:hypothetical protein